MTIWVFGYGSLIWKAGFPHDHRLVGFIRDYRRVFFQGSTDHRGTPEFPGRTVTLESAPGEVCHLEVREKQYDGKEYLNFFTVIHETFSRLLAEMLILLPGITLDFSHYRNPRQLSLLLLESWYSARYIASPDKKLNRNYLGPASFEDIARQIILAKGPSGPNRDYLFQLEKALIQIGHPDEHVTDLANEVRRLLSEEKLPDGEA